MENGNYFFSIVNKTWLIKFFETEIGIGAQLAVEKSLHLMKERVHGAGGVICICKKTAEPFFHFTTERMAWAVAQNDSLKWGLDPGELNQQSL